MPGLVHYGRVQNHFLHLLLKNESPGIIVLIGSYWRLLARVRLARLTRRFLNGGRNCRAGRSVGWIPPRRRLLGGRPVLSRRATLLLRDADRAKKDRQPRCPSG